MSQLTNQSDLPTDTYSMMPSSTPSKLGLDTNKKKMMGISAAALLLGGSAWAIVQKQKESGGENSTPEVPPVSSDNSVATNLPADVDVAGKITDTMSFEQAFAAARNEVGVGGVFGWHGHWYNTFDKEEWASLSLDQRQEFTEMITQEHLPVRPYHQAVPSLTPSEEVLEPTIIEGHLNGQRVMGLDFDQDGTIDTLVMEGADGYTYRVVDATGDDGLDTVFRYDSLQGELVRVEKIEEPFVLSNEQFSQGLEESMSKEVVNSILEDDSSTTLPPVNGNTEENTDLDEDSLVADSHEADDTYINDGDVRDMHE